MGDGMGGRVTGCVAVRAWRAHELVATPVEFVDGSGDGARARHAPHFVQWVGGNLWCVHPYPSLNIFFFSNTQAEPGRGGWCGTGGPKKAKEGGTGR